jgi:hypothetical protein
MIEASIMFAPLHAVERHNDPRWNHPGRTLYEQKAIRFMPGVIEIPLLVDHDKTQQVGVVDLLYRLEWTDGPWMVASATVHEPPAWLTKHDTKASFSFIALSRGSFTACEHVMDAFVREVSILSPGTEPAEPLARVLRLAPVDEPPNRTPAGEVIYGGGIIRRPGIGQVLRVR